MLEKFVWFVGEHPDIDIIQFESQYIEDSTSVTRERMSEIIDTFLAQNKELLK